MSRFAFLRYVRLPMLHLGLAWTVSIMGHATAEGGLNIQPTFDSSVTSNSDATNIVATINSVVALYQSKFSDNITVPITFKTMSSGLGQSSKPIYYVPTSTYLTWLRSDASTASDTTALSRLPVASTDPVVRKTYIFVAQANLRALGYNPGTSSDGTISINTSLTNNTRTSISSSKYDLFAVVAHEIDEILGLGSGLNISKQYGGYIMPQDLFRYGSTSRQRSYSTSTSVASYFSIDGVNKIVRFNQNNGADYGDWYSSGTHTPRVQDAFGTPGITIDPGSAEYTALDVIGYNYLSSTSSITTTTTTKSAGSTNSFSVVKFGGHLVELVPTEDGEYTIRAAIISHMGAGDHHPLP